MVNSGSPPSSTELLYVVLRGDGTLKGRKRGPVTAFRSPASAQRFAKDPGDSVLAVTVDRTREPVFIRRRVL